MADLKISQLSATASPSLSSLLPIVADGYTKKISLSTLYQKTKEYIDSFLTDVELTSANWNSVYSSVAPVSANWNSVYSNVRSNSANWEIDIDVNIRALSATWQDAITNVQSNSALWNTAGSSAGADYYVRALSAVWQNTYSSVNAVSANWNSVYSNVQTNSATWNIDSTTDTGVRTLTSTWQDTATLVQANSALWEESSEIIPTVTNYLSTTNISVSGLTVVGDLHGDGSKLTGIVAGDTEATNLVRQLSAEWNYQATDLKSLSSEWNGGNFAYTTVNSNSSNWDSVYSNVQANSANTVSVYSSVAPVSANWNSVYSNVQSNSAAYATISFANTKFLPLSGGIVTDNVRFDQNVTIYGNLSCSGTQAFANTVFSTTSALSVVHVGSGPAMWVGNNGSGDIASFYDIDQNVEVLHVGGNDGTFPNVGVKTSTPNKDFTVNGEISAKNTIYDGIGNSTNWNSVYSSVAPVSANWNSVYSNVQSNSATWNSVYTTIQSNSATWRLEDFIVACSDETTALNVTTSATTFRVPFQMYLNSVRASVNVAPVGSTIIVNVKQNNSSIFSTNLSIDANEKTSTTAAVPAVISTNTLIDDAQITVDITQVGSTTAGAGLKLTFKGYRI